MTYIQGVYGHENQPVIVIVVKVIEIVIKLKWHSHPSYVVEINFKKSDQNYLFIYSLFISFMIMYYSVVSFSTLFFKEGRLGSDKE